MLLQISIGFAIGLQIFKEPLLRRSPMFWVYEAHFRNPEKRQEHDCTKELNMQVGLNIKKVSVQNLNRNNFVPMLSPPLSTCLSVCLCFFLTFCLCLAVSPQNSFLLFGYSHWERY